MMELIQSGTTPVVTAFLLGLLTAISPCPLATNITAIGFLSKDIDNRHKIFWGGILYTVGRILTYTLLGLVLITVLRQGASMFVVQKIVAQYGEALIAPALIIIGLFMLFGDKLKLSKFGLRVSGFKKSGFLGAVQCCFWVFFFRLLFVQPAECFTLGC